jgi:hypothetical protein
MYRVVGQRISALHIFPASARLALITVNLVLDEFRSWSQAKWHYVEMLVAAENEVGPK